MATKHVGWALAPAGFLLVIFLSHSVDAQPHAVPVPQIDGPWWQVAGNPMDHKYATDKQEPVDFAVWQAADGTWQLWSCIRGTTAGGPGGKTRFFYRWEGKHLTDPNWTPDGHRDGSGPGARRDPGRPPGPARRQARRYLSPVLRGLGQHLPRHQ